MAQWSLSYTKTVTSCRISNIISSHQWHLLASSTLLHPYSWLRHHIQAIVSLSFLFQNSAVCASALTNSLIFWLSESVLPLLSWLYILPLDYSIIGALTGPLNLKVWLDSLQVQSLLYCIFHWYIFHPHSSLSMLAYFFHLFIYLPFNSRISELCLRTILLYLCLGDS